MDDHECITQVLAGNRDAYEHIVRRYHRRLYYYVVGKIADDCEAEDIVQKTFVTAFHSLMSFDMEHQLIDWLRGIALNHCRNEWKMHARRARLKDRLLEARRSDWQLDLLEKSDAAAEERVAALRACIEKLSQAEQKVVHQRFVEEQPLRSIGEALGKTGEATRLVLFRIRQRLAECVKRRLALAEAVP